MKIFGFEFTTKKELRHTIDVLNADLEACEDELAYVEETFPFDIGQVVYDIALKMHRASIPRLNPPLTTVLLLR